MTEYNRNCAKESVSLEHLHRLSNKQWSTSTALTLHGIGEIFNYRVKQIEL